MDEILFSDLFSLRWEDSLICETIDPYEYFDDSFEKEYAEILTEASSNPVKKSKVLDKILMTIRKIFFLIQKGFNKVMDFIKKLFSKKEAPKTMDQILVELGVIGNEEAKAGKYEILKNSNAQNPMAMSDIDLALKPLIVKFDESSKAFILSENKIMKNLVSGSPKVKGHAHHVGSALTGYHTAAFDIIADPKSIDRIKKIADWIANGGPADPNLINDINYIRGSMKSISRFDKRNWKLSMQDLNRMQEAINYAHQKISVLDNPYQGNWEDVKVKTLNSFAMICTEIQFGINVMMASLKNIYVMDASYVNSINDENVLAKFVETMVQHNIPAKYVALNVYLAASTSLKGDKANPLKPVWGETRTVIFPPDKDYVIKIGINAFGARANQSELKIWNKVKDTYAKDYFAGVVGLSSNGYVERMEKMDAKYMVDPASLMVFRSDLKKICKDLNIPINLNVDMHFGNVAINPRTKKPVTIDYGISLRTAI